MAHGSQHGSASPGAIRHLQLADVCRRSGAGAKRRRRSGAAEKKFDVAISRVTRISGNNQLVYFFSLDNVFDRTNLYEYTYTSDYSRRIPVRSLFTRSLYFGASLTHLQR